MAAALRGGSPGAGDPQSAQGRQRVGACTRSHLHCQPPPHGRDPSPPTLPPKGPLTTHAAAEGTPHHPRCHRRDPSPPTPPCRDSAQLGHRSSCQGRLGGAAFGAGKVVPPTASPSPQEASPAPDLSQVELQDVADIMRGGLGQLHQLLPVLKCLAELLHAGLDAVDSVDAL